MFISRYFLAALLVPFASCFAADAPPDFQWISYMAPGQTLEIRLIDGTIHVEPSDGADVQVTAWKTGSRPDPATVQIETEQRDGDLLICVVYPSPPHHRPNRCTFENSDNEVLLSNEDLKVDFVVRIPAGVKLRGSVVNGSAEMTLRDNPADVSIVNGPVAATTEAPLTATVVNGSIEASLGTVHGFNALTVVNGTVNPVLASSANTKVHARIVFGPITSDFPLRVKHHLVGSNADGVLGAGEGSLQLSAVNGKIILRRAADPEQ